MIIVFIHAIIVLSGNRNTCVNNRHQHVPSKPLVDWLVDQQIVMISWLWTLDVIDNEITSLGEWCDGQDPILNIAQDRIVRLLEFWMSSIFSLDHEIV